MKTILHFVFTLFFVCSMATTSFGLDLQDAKAQGLVGETPGGYLAPVKGGNKEVAQLVKTINGKRKQHYQEIAQRNKAPLNSVEQLAGKKAIEKTPAGQFIQVGGEWKRK
ncbi:MAG: hypothetical protein CSB34_07460 [Desulfobulbus propionicus]|nr:MAG: hypothetical protein CSB34_07460 [Desulfobulbus propionicus]